LVAEIETILEGGATASVGAIVAISVVTAAETWEIAHRNCPQAAGALAIGGNTTLNIEEGLLTEIGQQLIASEVQPEATLWRTVSPVHANSSGVREAIWLAIERGVQA
jgi:hypothetical protein